MEFHSWQPSSHDAYLPIADAYIAGAVAAVSENSGAAAYLEYSAQKPAAELVIAGQATSTNTAWTQAYADVVTAVEADATYSDLKDAPYNGSAKEIQDEATVLKVALVYFKVDAALAGMSGFYGVGREVTQYLQRLHAHSGG
jgi:hypothetical protein